MLNRHALCLFLAYFTLGAESFGFDSLSQLPIFKENVHPKVSEGGDGLFRAMGPAPPLLGKRIPQEERKTWKLDCTSKLTIHDCGKVIDGENNTFWQTNVNGQPTKVPHSITIDLRESKNINALSMRPLPDADLGGAVAGHRVYISADKKTWKLVAFGTWFGDVQGRFLVILLLSPQPKD